MFQISIQIIHSDPLDEVLRNDIQPLYIQESETFQTSKKVQFDQIAHKNSEINTFL